MSSNSSSYQIRELQNNELEVTTGSLQSNPSQSDINMRSHYVAHDFITLDTENLQGWRW